MSKTKTMTRWESEDVVLERPLASYSLSLTFHTERPMQEVLARCKDMGFRISEREFLSADLFGVSSVQRPFGAFFCGHVRTAGHGPTHIELHLKRKPEGEPPPDIAKASERAGGYPEALGKFAAAWASDDLLVFDVEADFLKLDKKAKPFLKPHKVAQSRVRGFKLVNEMLEFETPKSYKFIKSLKLFFDKHLGFWEILVKGTVELPMSKDLFDKVDALIWEEVAKVLE